MQTRAPFPVLILCLLLFARTAAAAGTGTVAAAVDAKTGLSHEWSKWFQGSSAIHKLAESSFPVYAVTTAAGQANGWVFRTDQVPPVVNGKRGQIGVMVGFGRDGLIKGVHVVENREDAAWFNRLKPGFYAQFNGKPANRQGVTVDTVAGATVSSRAVVDDVFLSSQSVMALPEVHPLLRLMPAKAEK